MAVRVVYSLDGGTTWLDFSPFLTAASNVAGAYLTQSPVAAPVNLAVNASVIFGMRPDTPVTVGDPGCSLTVRLDTHTGASSAYDTVVPVQRLVQ